MLYQFLASPPRLDHLPVLLAGVPTFAATNLRSIRVSSLKTVNSARHQGECELAPAVLSAPIKMTMKKTGSVSVLSFRRSRLPPPPAFPRVLPIESYLNGSYALIDPFRRLKVSRPKYRARDVYGGRS